jgi:hypothetical protein
VGSQALPPFRSGGSESSGAMWVPCATRKRRPGWRWALIDQPVEFRGVLAGDLVYDIGWPADELLLDVF